MISPEQIQNALTGYCDGPGCRIFPNNVGCAGFMSTDGKLPPCYKKPEKRKHLNTRALETLKEELNRSLSESEKETVDGYINDLEVRKVPPEALERIRQENRKAREEREAAEAEYVANLTSEGRAVYQQAIQTFGNRGNFSFAVIRQLSKLRINPE